MTILQLNLNHCEAAQDLLLQTVHELKIDVAIVCEQYKNVEGAKGVADASGRAAIWACGKFPIQEARRAPRTGFVWAKVDGIYIYSCYASPNAPIEDLEELLHQLATDARIRSPLVIAGDFNAWANEWGSRETNLRGETLLQSFAQLDIVLVNNGHKPTFTRSGTSSIVDLTFVSEVLCRQGVTWEVSDLYTHSDHQAILCTLKIPGRICRRRRTEGGPRWKAKAFDEDAFGTIMEQNVELSGSPEDKAQQIMSLITEATDASMPRTSGNARRPPVYWWNEGIADLRRRCHRARRLYQRARGRREYRVLQQWYKQARREFKGAIKASKRKSWTELCSEVNSDPWGRPYKIAMTKLKSSPMVAPTTPELMHAIVSTLFPQQQATRHEEEHPIPIDEVPPITMEELLAACKNVGDAKAPGLDGIPNVALKSAIRVRPDIFLEVYNACLLEGIFPKPWKKQRLVLLPKGKAPPEDPSSYRPICLLDTTGKILERIICRRLEIITEGEMGLSKNQFGFRKARSTVDAINLVVNIAHEAIQGKRWRRGSKKYCAIVTLDVKNAFNSARWSCILDALQHLGVPAYLRQIVNDYFKDRTLMYHTENGSRAYEVTGGVPQGSVLGPTLWNVMYDALLRLQMPEGSTVIGFADDVAVVITGKYVEEVVQIANESIANIRHWMSTVGLQLADHKTEVVLVTSRKVRETITLTVGNREVESRSSLKYLGVLIDERLRFNQHVQYASAKAAKVASALSRIMPNIGGPRQSRRRLLSCVTTAILLYAAPIWVSVMSTEAHRRKVTSVYRTSALRVSCAFRTVSYDAVCVVAGMPPIEVLADERHRLYRRGRQESQAEQRAMVLEERQRSMSRWQQQWDASSKGRWTHRLIPQIDGWTDRKHGETDHYLTQLLTGHGCFRAYQLRFKLDDTPECPACPSVVEDAEHVFFGCPRFQEEREALHGLLEIQPSPETIVVQMLVSQERWDAVGSFATVIIKKLRLEERGRREE